MTDKPKFSRIVLDEKSQEYLNEMLLVLKGEGSHIKVSPSSLVCWIVSYFARSGFHRQKKKIIKDHFNSKEYLRHIANNLGESDNLETVLRETLNQIKVRQKRKNVKKDEERKALEAKED